MEKLQMRFSDLPEDIQDKIIEIKEENDLAKIEFDFEGRWGDSEIMNLEYDNKWIFLTTELENLFFDTVEYIMKKNYGRYWSDDGGIRGSVYIMGDDIFIDALVGLIEWEYTNMDIDITLKNIEDYEK